MLTLIRQRPVLKWLLIVLAAGILLVGLTIQFEYTLIPEAKELLAGSDEKQGLELGRLLFATRGCNGCHQFRDIAGTAIGPDLTDIAARADHADVRHSILNPEAEISEHCRSGPCPIGLMPGYAGILDDRQIEALVMLLMHTPAD